MFPSTVYTSVLLPDIYVTTRCINWSLWRN